MPKRDKKLVTRCIPAFIARTQFGQILERVSEEKERILVTKNGEAKAVILGVEDFLQTVVKTPGSLRALQEEAKRSGANKLTVDDIEAEIQAVRRAKTSQQA
jgi:prevent-host-death family protein